jgi:hypothetical protein
MKKGFALTAKGDNGIMALTETELKKYKGYNFKIKVAKAPNHARLLGRMENGNMIFDVIVHEK